MWLQVAIRTSRVPFSNSHKGIFQASCGRQSGAVLPCLTICIHKPNTTAKAVSLPCPTWHFHFCICLRLMLASSLTLFPKAAPMCFGVCSSSLYSFLRASKLACVTPVLSGSHPCVRLFIHLFFKNVFSIF